MRIAREGRRKRICRAPASALERNGECFGEQRRVLWRDTYIPVLYSIGDFKTLVVLVFSNRIMVLDALQSSAY